MKFTERNIYRIIRKVGYKRGAITEIASLIDDFGFDAIDILQMTNMLEYQFNIKINDRDIPKLSTVGCIVEYIHCKHQ